MLNQCEASQAAAQQFLVTPDGTARQVIRKADGFCLEVVADGGAGDGARVRVAECQPQQDQSQTWVFDGRTLKDARTGLLLDRKGYGKTVGTQVYVWHSTGVSNQQWVYNATDLTLRAADAPDMCLDAGGDLPQPDLVGRLNVWEKQALLVNGAAGVPRLNVAPYEWWNEALHGVGYSPGVVFGGSLPFATSFPQVITTAASWNRSLFADIARTISTEARAFSNSHRAGLTFWTPNVNIFRDPRWGRGQETPGEDPLLTSEYARVFVRGMQEGEDPRYLKTSACCKHFTAYDFENEGPVNRHNFDAVVTDQDMADTFMPPFQSCVQKARASSLMCSYNRVNGVPTCASSWLMTTTAREQWGFDGYITSDCGAVDDVIYGHHYTDTTDKTVAAVLGAGMDIECGGFFKSKNNLVNAVSHGALNESTLDRAVFNTFMMRYRLGLFDPLSTQPYAGIMPDRVNTPAAKALAHEAALEGIVLLKNERQSLPLQARSVAVIGPNAAATQTLIGNYFGEPEHVSSIIEGIQSFAEVKYVQGCDVACRGFDANVVTQAAQSADASVVVIGIDQGMEAEDRDRSSIALPGNQEKLVSTVAAASRYPGQSGGRAIAEVIFGKYNPGGRLPYTMYPSSYTSMVAFQDMGMRPTPDGRNPGRTYRFFNGNVVYPFGHGLSYTQFKYSVASSTAMTLAKSSVATEISKLPVGSYLTDDSRQLDDVRIDVTNIGDFAGSESVLAFISPPNAGKDGRPIKTLVGFERVFLQPGETTTVVFAVTAGDVSVVNRQGHREAVTGVWQFTCGSEMVPIIVY
eukprot:m51a1_g4029 putative probable beta-d-xylosidase 2 (803) ;mRNA; f:642026-644784